MSHTKIEVVSAGSVPPTPEGYELDSQITLPEGQQQFTFRPAQPAVVVTDPNAETEAVEEPADATPIDKLNTAQADELIAKYGLTVADNAKLADKRKAIKDHLDANPA